MTALGRAIGCSRGDRFAWSTARKVTCPSSLAVSDCNLIQRNDRNLIQHKTPNKTTPTSGRVPRRGSPSGDSQLRADSPPDSTPPGRVEWWEGGCEAGWSRARRREPALEHEIGLPGVTHTSQSSLSRPSVDSDRANMCPQSLSHSAPAGSPSESSPRVQKLARQRLPKRPPRVVGGNPSAAQFAQQIGDQDVQVVQLLLVDSNGNPSGSQKCALPAQEFPLILGDLGEAIKLKAHLPPRQRCIRKVHPAFQFNRTLRDELVAYSFRQHALQQPPNVCFARRLKARICNVHYRGRLPATSPADDACHLASDDVLGPSLLLARTLQGPPIEFTGMCKDRAHGNHRSQRMEITCTVHGNNPKWSCEHSIDWHGLKLRHGTHQLSLFHFAHRNSMRVHGPECASFVASLVALDSVRDINTIRPGLQSVNRQRRLQRKYRWRSTSSRERN